MVIGHCDLFHVAKMKDSFRQRIHKYWPEFHTDDRVARVIVFPLYIPLLKRLHEQPADLPTMVEQITDCLDALYHKAGILHRDVSAYNIMWQPSGGTGNFVLCDFDLAIDVRRDGSALERVATAPHRTGTLPFLALELLENDRTPHRLYHDYESLFWVVLWCAMKVDYRDKNTDRAAIDNVLHGWESTTLSEIYHKKKKVLETRCQTLPLSQRFKSSTRIAFLLRALSWLLLRALVDGTEIQLQEQDSVAFGAKVRSWGDIMDSLVCKKTIMEALEGAAKQAEELEARMAAASRSQPEPLAT
ncbi:hypothetical protein FKP32DRAFT_1647135 [Trametes sanguinea]|nr:hypothetical protein FKP32DRAFT_1647135 [Trametes sanguinea]